VRGLGLLKIKYIIRVTVIIAFAVQTPKKLMDASAEGQENLAAQLKQQFGLSTKTSSSVLDARTNPWFFRLDCSRVFV
jgi:hypothetical protein